MTYAHQHPPARAPPTPPTPPPLTRHFRLGRSQYAAQICARDNQFWAEGENILQAGIRETKEETGIALDPLPCAWPCPSTSATSAPRTPASGSRSNPATGTASPSSASQPNAPSSCGPTPAACHQIRSSTPPSSSAPSSEAPPWSSTDGDTWSPEGIGIVRPAPPRGRSTHQDWAVSTSTASPRPRCSPKPWPCSAAASAFALTNAPSHYRHR